MNEYLPIIFYGSFFILTIFLIYALYEVFPEFKKFNKIDINVVVKILLDYYSERRCRGCIVASLCFFIFIYMTLLDKKIIYDERQELNNPKVEYKNSANGNINNAYIIKSEKESNIKKDQISQYQIYNSIDNSQPRTKQNDPVKVIEQIPDFPTYSVSGPITEIPDYSKKHTKGE